MNEKELKLQSKLFSSLFEGVDASRPLIVLDIGSAVPETVNFFSDFRCRLHFADLYSAPIVQHQKNPATDAVLDKQFKRLLDFPPGTKFDICMFWDILNFLDVPAFRAFNKALSPYVDKNTRAHGFGVLNKQKSLEQQDYGIQQGGNLCVKQHRGKELKPYPHQPADVNLLLRCFKINKRLLLPDGRLEMLLDGQNA